MESIALVFGPIGVTGTGISGTGAAVLVVIALIIYLVQVRPSFEM
jgi:hypothetical protein